MNYIKEINAFYDHQEREPLSGSAVALWYALMHMNNKTRWKNTFTSPGSVLQNKAGLSASSFKRARTELVDAGYIEVASQGRNKAPIYKMRSLVVEVVEEDGQVPDRTTEPRLEENGQSGQSSAYLPNQNENHSLLQPMNHSSDQHQNLHVDHSPDHHPNQAPTPLIKQYKNNTNTKENHDDAAAAGVRTFIFNHEKKEQDRGAPDALKFYQENFGVVSPFVAESLMDWIRSLGEELVMEAMKRALERNVLSWAYVRSILKAWEGKGIRTVAGAKAELVGFQRERGRKYGGGGGYFGGEDIVPDWYDEEKERQRLREAIREGEKRGTREEVEERMRELGIGAK
ncbi:DnaD domain-containing protein [Oceanobacillus alkalisoli]|uniref:DnaD domain-containing protein n=1 Tax=Oceanobacillus alkalisoli TaxID=2925113 RepID=UPI001F1202A6|nr:DnaD domain protein [Oceanobacillus alkalisoli]MCF3942604.1 DnaD domain protein [Oceanobacillus alkalisoli]